MKKSKKILFVFAFIALWYHKDNNILAWYSTTLDTKVEKIQSPMTPANIEVPQTKMKYILQWTNPQNEPFKFLETGQRTFIRRRCFVKKCYVTSNKRLLNNLQDFDAILFNGPEMSSNFFRLPGRRSLRQKYVFVSIESSAIYPFRYNLKDGYFNWTWSYKLNSDINYRYLIVKNKYGDIIGPKSVMNWMKVEEMKPIDDKLKKKLKSKSIAAAWFVSHCGASSKRDDIVNLLQQELAKYNMTVDIYGACGNKSCPRFQMNECLRMLETDYYFYLSFENSNADDYVTEKVLHALQHYTVPIVYGGANYTRFMPDGIYLNVRTQGLKALVKQMVDIINDKRKYYDYFRWMNHYSYHYPEEFPESDYYCEFCRKMNDFKLVSQTRYINKINEWWNLKPRKNILENFTKRIESDQI